MLMKKMKYKVYADVGCSMSSIFRQLVALDTGAGLNFIWQYLIPTDLLARMRTTRLPYVSDANDRTIITLEMMTVVVRLVRLVYYFVKVEFVVCST